jgi:hypothetical protein
MASSSTIMNSRTAVVPSASMACWTLSMPGSCTLMRLPPLRTMDGSFTPVSSMRFRSVSRACFTDRSAIEAASSSVTRHAEYVTSSMVRCPSYT